MTFRLERLLEGGEFGAELTREKYGNNFFDLERQDTDY